MAAITNYTTLVQAIKDIAEDDSAEYSAYIPTAIDIAEERLMRELDLPDQQVISTGSMVVGASTIAKPSQYKYIHQFSFTANNVQTTLVLKDLSYVQDYWPNQTLKDVPKYYANYSSTHFKVAPTPDAAYAYTYLYSQQPTKLSTSNLTNYFTDKCKDILFAATMSEMAKFMKAWSQVPLWEQTYKEAAGNWNIAMKRVRRDDMSNPMTLEGPNTLAHTTQNTTA